MPRFPADLAHLQDVVASDPLLQAGRGRMLVFARDVAAAGATAADLAGAGLPVLQYHKGVPAAERAVALGRMRAEQGLVMVCTDAAARGLDVPDVSHVVQVRFFPAQRGRHGEQAAMQAPSLQTGCTAQACHPSRPAFSPPHTRSTPCVRPPASPLFFVARTATTCWPPFAASPQALPPFRPTPPLQADFAQSAVDFLHRVGRTARAGRAGRVTSLFTPDAEPLVQAIRDNIAAGEHHTPIGFHAGAAA